MAESKGLPTEFPLRSAEQGGKHNRSIFMRKAGVVKSGIQGRKDEAGLRKTKGKPSHAFAALAELPRDFMAAAGKTVLPKNGKGLEAADKPVS